MTEESEESCLVNSKLMPLGNYPVMSYTEGIIAASSASLENTASHQPHQSATEACNSGTSAGHPIQSGRASQQSQITETGELIELNNELMLSQFHFDAIKQVSAGIFVSCNSNIYKFSLTAGWMRTLSIDCLADMRTQPERPRRPSVFLVLHNAVSGNRVLHCGQREELGGQHNVGGLKCGLVALGRIS